MNVWLCWGDDNCYDVDTKGKKIMISQEYEKETIPQRESMTLNTQYCPSSLLK